MPPFGAAEPRRALRAGLLAALLPVLASACSEEIRETTRLGGAIMGTTWSVQVVAPAPLDPEEREDLETSIVDLLARIDALMSTYRDDSEILRLNRAPAGQLVPLSRETLEVLELAQRVSDESGGAFDVTVGPLVELWGFGRRKTLDEAPSDDVLAAFEDRIGREGLRLDPDAGGAVKARSDLEVDLSAVAKGFAVDAVADLLAARGWLDHLVEIGGEIRAAGSNPRGLPWRLGIERPELAVRTVHRVVALRDRAMATSGDYRNFYEIDGVRYSHTLDPRTLRPVTHSTASVTVIHESAADADAWATALLVLGSAAGSGLAEERGLAALFLDYTEEGLAETSTPALAAHLTIPSP